MKAINNKIRDIDRSIQKLSNEKKAKKPMSKISIKKHKKKLLLQQLFDATVDNVSKMMLSSGRYLGEYIRNNIDTNPKKGHQLFPELCCGTAELCLFNEFKDAEKKIMAMGTEWPIYGHIAVSAYRANYLKFKFKFDPESIEETPVGIVKVKGNPAELDRFPTVGLVGPNDEFIPMANHTKFLKKVCYYGLASRTGQEYIWISGSVIDSPNIKKEECFVQSVLHADVDVPLESQKKGPSCTFIMNILGETPLDFGSVARYTQKAGGGKNLQAIILKPGDAVLFAGRQYHRTGKPSSFPSPDNVRVHFMFCNCEEDAIGDNQAIFPSEEMNNHYEKLLANPSILVDCDNALP